MKKRLTLPALRAGHQPRRLSQSRTARLAGMGTFRFWQIENGEGPDVTSDEKIVIAAVLGVAVSDIDWPEPLAVQRAS